MIAKYFKENWKDMLSVLFFLICYGTSICLFLGGVKDPIIPSDLELPIFMACSLAEIIAISLFVVLEIKIFRMKINIPLVIILFCLLIMNSIVIIATPLTNTFEFNYYNSIGITIITITNEWKMMYLICFFLLLLNIYISFNYLIYRINFKKHFVWICLLCVFFALSLVIYSYIAEWETYKLFIDNIGTTVRDYNPKSITNNSNNYAAILLGAGFCCYALYIVTNKHIFWVIGLFFCANIVFPMSRICLLLAIFISLMVFLYRMIVTWKGNAFRNLNLLLLLVLPMVIFVSMCFTIPTLKEYISTILFTKSSSINERKPLWVIAITMTQGIHRFVGNGHGYFNSAFVISNAKGIKMPHNLYIQIYGALGFVGLGLFVVLVCFAIYKIIKLFRTNRDAAFVSLIGLLVVLSYYIMEG